MAKRAGRKSGDVIALMLRQGKSNSRILMNTCLLLITFAIFALIVAIPSWQLLATGIFTMQLVLAVPFLLTSTLANSKLAYTTHERHWDDLGGVNFIIGYGLLLNVIGILVFFLIGIMPALLFFAVNILLTLVYSGVHISYDRNSLMRRAVKDILLIGILLVFGISQIL